MNKLLQSLGVVGLLAFAACTNAQEDSEWHPMARAVNAILDELPSEDSESGFTARMSRIEDDFVGTYALEDPVSVKFTADEDRYLSIAFLDTQGFLVLLQLDMGHGLGNVKGGGGVQEYPPRGIRFMETHPPLGWERAYYVATRNPVDQGVFESALNTGGDGTKVFELDRSIEVAKNYVAAVLASNSPSEISIVALDSHIVERNHGPRYTSDEIAGYYTKRGTLRTTGSVLDSRIRFEANSAELSEKAQRSLYVWGEALLYPRIAGYKFHIVGHADSEESNQQQLSEERAKAAVDYLVSTFDIDEERMTAVGAGANSPVPVNASDGSRAANRRVEFMQVLD